MTIEWKPIDTAPVDLKIIVFYSSPGAPDVGNYATGEIWQGRDMFWCSATNIPLEWCTHWAELSPPVSLA